MVWFLIAMNLLMLAIISITDTKQKTIPEKAIASSVSYLKKSGFDIDREKFPDRYRTLPSYSVKFYTASNLSEIFFGKQVAFRTNENSLVATEGKAVLTVNDNSFSYTDGYEATDGNYSGYKLKKLLKDCGFDMSDAVYDKKTGCFYKMCNGINLFNMYIEAKADKDGEICSVRAQWPKKLTASERRRISFIESIPKLKSYFNGGKIENIELGYYLRKSASGSFTFFPGWRVTIDGNMKIVE